MRLPQTAAQFDAEFGRAVVAEGGWWQRGDLPLRIDQNMKKGGFN